MKQLILSAGLFFTLSFSSAGQSTKDSKGFGIAMDSLGGSHLLRQCSRFTPIDISSFWVVSKTDANELEKNFPAIDSLKSAECCRPGAKITNRGNYAFQYIGVVINNRKFIYINAFPATDIAFMKKIQKDFNPKHAPIIVCDGGKSYWGALYDIETKTFSQLCFNGYA